MKNLILLLLFVTSGSLMFAQNAKKFTSGDVELDNAIKSVTAYGRKNPAAFQGALVAKYFITEAKATEYYANYTGGDLFVIFETAKVLNKDAETVFTTFKANRGYKGWDETLKELGVKQDSKSFATIKDAVVNNGLN